jgi:hypothetical protein
VWSVLVGDILSNLRAALDHVAWAIASKYADQRATEISRSEAEHIYFPLRIHALDQNRGAFFGGLNNNDLKFFPPDLHSIFEYYQPYHRASRLDAKLLSVVAELVAIDKHRSVTPVLQETRFRLTDGDEYIPRQGERVERLQFIARDIVGSQAPADIAFEAVLEVPSMAPEYFPLTEFGSIHQVVANEVIPRFARAYFE